MDLDINNKKNLLPYDKNDYSYRFYKNLNEDVYLTSDEWGDWDITFHDDLDDWVNVNGEKSMRNACIIAIMTRFSELNFMPLYEDFGCRVHELIKTNKKHLNTYKIETYVLDTLNNMRRVKRVNYVNVTDGLYGEGYNYRVHFSVTCKVDDDIDEEDNTCLAL